MKHMLMPKDHSETLSLLFHDYTKAYKINIVTRKIIVEEKIIKINYRRGS